MGPASCLVRNYYDYISWLERATQKGLKKVLATREKLSFWVWKPADETIKTVMIQRWKLMGISDVCWAWKPWRVSGHLVPKQETYRLDKEICRETKFYQTFRELTYESGRCVDYNDVANNSLFSKLFTPLMVSYLSPSTNTKGRRFSITWNKTLQISVRTSKYNLTC